MEWKKVKIGDICSKICSGGTPKSSNIAYYGGNIPWLNTKEVNFNRIYSTEQTITQEGLDNSAAKWIDVNSIIIAMYGATAGKVAITKIPLTPNQACCNLTIDNNIADYNFVYYAIVNNYEALSSLANGSAQQNLNSLVIKEFPLFLPPLPYQRRISSILSDYDSLIENYQRQISLLEESAKRIYKEWFVDFKFPGVEMAENGLPKGWQKKKLGEICESITRTSNDLKEQLIFLNTGDVENGEILHSNYSPTTEMPGQAKKLIKKNDILYSEIRPINRHFAYVNFDCEDYIVSTKLMVIKAKDGINSRRLYQFLTFDDTIKALQIEAESRSGTFPQIRFENVSKLHLIIGDERIEKEYDCVLSDFFTKIENMKTQIRLLRQNRDILLPRLMNGEIEIEG